MYECFLEIAYEAEIDTSENPELLEIAPQLCNEYPATRMTAVAELRKMIYDRGECRPLRTDDQYMLRFLRARKFVVPRAYRLLVRYCEFREQYPHLYKDVDLWGLMRVKGAYEGSMYDRPDVGRLSILRFGAWDPSEFPVEELLRAGLAVSEIGIRQPKMQIMGGVVLVDMEGITLRHVATLTPSIAYQITCLLGIAVPIRANTTHIVNCSWIVNTFIYLFKRFLPQKIWDNIYFHGFDMKSLHKHIDPECLPIRYGGTCRNHVQIGTWLQKIKKYRDEQLDKDMKDLGYIVKE